MLRRFSLAAAFAAVLLTGAQTTTAQRTLSLKDTPAAFRTFYKNFAVTVKRGRIDLLAGMTNFPFKYGFDAGDEGVWTKKQFLKKANRFLIPRPPVFTDDDPEFTVSNGVYTLAQDVDASYYTFKKKGGVYKWVSYIVEP